MAGQTLSLAEMNSRLAGGDAVPVPAVLSLSDMNQRLAGPGSASPVVLSLDQMNDLLASGNSTPRPSAQMLALPGRGPRHPHQSNDLPQPHGRPAVQQPSLGERLNFNLRDAIDNTIRGAYAMKPGYGPTVEGTVLEPGFQTAPELAGSPIADLAASPFGQMAQAETARQAGAVERERLALVKANRLRQQFPLPAPRGVAQNLTAAAGQAVGSMTSPEAFIPVGRGATLLRTFLKGAAVNGLTALVTDPIVQQAQIDAGVRDKFDPLQTFLSAGGGAFLGGVLNISPEVASHLAGVVGAQLRKAANAVTNSDIFNALRGWALRPDTLPPELRQEPTFSATQPEGPAAPAAASPDGVAVPESTPAPTAEAAPAAPQTPAGAMPRPTDNQAAGATPSPGAPALPPDIPKMGYRGFGRADQASAYNPAVGSNPLLGRGHYFAFTPEGASEFGPQVETRPLDFQNPLIIRSDDQWRALTRAAGWQFPNPYGQPPERLAENATRLQEYLRSRGHDGVIAWWDDSAPGDTDAQGRPIKTLRSVFGQPQAFYPESVPARPSWLREPKPGEFLPDPDLPDVAEARGPSKPLRETRVPVSAPVRSQIGIGMGHVFADYTVLQSKHPDVFSTPEDVRRHVEYTFEAPTHILPGNEPDHRLLVRTNGGNKAAVLEIELRGGKYRVKSAYTIPDDQLARRLEDVGRRQGGNPGVPVQEGPSPSGDSGRLPSPRDELQPAPDNLGPDGLPDKSESRAPGTLSIDEMAQRLNASAGGSYVGAAPQTFNPSVAATKGEPVRRENILRQLVTDLNTALYQGRVKGKGTLGFYRKRIEEVRVKNANDIETAAHELAHLLDDRIPEIRSQWLPANAGNAAIRKELAGVSYDKSKLYEGFSEFVRLWMTQPNQASAKAPLFNAWFDNFVKTNKVGPALLRAREGMLNWFNQAAVDRARSKIGATQEINGGDIGVWNNFRQSVLDDLHGIERMERDLTGKIAPAGAYETARLTRAKASIVEGALLYGAPKVNRDGSHTFVGKGLKEILAPIADRLDDALMYFVGKSAHELRQQGRENLFSAAEIQGMLALRDPAFDRAFAEYQVWNNNILDFAQAKGIINPFHRAAFKRAQYLPFHRVGQPGGAYSPTQGEFTGIKALTGGTDNLRSILGNMVGNARMLIEAALTNEARLKVAGLAREQGGAKFMAHIPRDDRLVAIPPQEVEQAVLKALGVTNRSQLTPEQASVIDALTNQMQDFARFILRGQSPTGANVVAVMRGGKADFYEVADPLLYRALSALNRPTANWLVRLLAIPRRIGQASVTLTPDFMAANIMRDAAAAWVMSRHGFKPGLDSVRGLVSRLRSDPNYRDFIANGGGLSSHRLDEAGLRANLERFYSRKGIDYRTVLDTPAKLLHAVERITDSFEMATRLGEYRQAVKRGEHPRHAAYSAREVSTDFAMRGDSQVIGALYDTVMFLKAGVTSMDRAFRAFAQDPNKGTVAAKTAGIALFSAGLYALFNRGNPLYEQLEDWDRDSSWHIFLPKPDTIRAMNDGSPLPPLEERYWHFRMPKIWEIGAFSSIAERQLEGILNGQPVDAQKKMLGIIANLFNLDYIPQAFAPLYELAINRDRFTGAPIETQAMQQLEPFARSGPYTSPTMARIGEATRDLPASMQLSPAQLEHLVRGYLNTWGMYGLAIADSLMTTGTPDARVDQLPVIRRFFRQEPAAQTRYLTELYRMIDESTQARATMKAMLKDERPDIAQEIANTPENRLFNQLDKASESLDALRKTQRAVYGANNLGDLQQLALDWTRSTGQPDLLAKLQNPMRWNSIGPLKRILLDDITRRRNDLAMRTVTSVQERKKQMEAVP